MQGRVNIGLDFGSLAWRAGHPAGGDVAALEGRWCDASRWLSCEPPAAENARVRFISVKSELGLPSRPRLSGAWDAKDIARRAFADLHDSVRQATGQEPGGLLVSVPALYPSTHREALRSLALEAGFPNVRLLNDSLSAVISHTHGRDGGLPPAAAGRFLVFGMGFGGFEAALIRVEGNRLSALAYEGGASPGGVTFDTSIADSFLRTLSSGPLRSYARLMTAADWLDLREEASRLKEMFSISERPRRRLWLRALRQPVDVEVPRQLFEAAFEAELRRAVNSAAGLLDETGLKPADLSEVLLVGGCTNLRLVQELVADEFARRPKLLAADSVMRGATILANSRELSAEGGQSPARELPLAGEPGSAIPLTEMSFSFGSGAAVAGEPEPKAAEPLEAVSDQTPPRGPAAGTSGLLEEASAHRKGLFEAARRLITEGSRGSATGLLEGVAEETNALLASLRGQGPGGGGDDEARLRLGHAKALLDKRQYGEAVTASHEAYALSKDSPDAYFEMIDIHCRAAVALGTMEGYRDSINMLMCAYDHDRTNSSIHERIAERHFRHAQQLAARGEREKVLATLKQCLIFKPDHTGAEALRAKLGSAA